MIDYRDFNNFTSLEKFVSQITEGEYNSYIKNIELFLETKEAKKWFDKGWAEDFLKSLH